ncbi:hypothetical protein [Stenotrophomonas acidaminiphila]|uniref:hypothetical protein n=1 Tax=Stenotrophomonas acidaminiphila TaxID=128780 RepID=UPI0039BCC137
MASMVEVVHDGNIYDLHNDFDAISITHDISANSLELVWHRSAIPNGSGCEYIRLQFFKLSVLSIRGVDSETPRREDARLSFMGYARPEDEQLNGFLPEELGDATCHMIIAFEGGIALKIFASEARLIIK